MSNTVPEIRVNKLGHSVTKHVRPSLDTGKGRKLPPAPISASPEDCKKLTRATLQSMRDSGLPLLNSNYATKNVYQLAKTNPELLGRIEARASNASSVEKAIWNQVLSADTRFPAGRDAYYDPTSLYERDLRLVPIAASVKGNRADPESIVADMEKCSELVPEEYSHDGDTVSACFIAMEVDRSLKPTYNYEFDYSQYAAEISQIAERPEQVADIVGELIKRETLDPGVIDSILDVSSSSLREGAL